MFEEFPKWVTLKDGSTIIVQNADEEALVLAPPKTKGKAVTEPPTEPAE